MNVISPNTHEVVFKVRGSLSLLESTDQSAFVSDCTLILENLLPLVTDSYEAVRREFQRVFLFVLQKLTIDRQISESQEWRSPVPDDTKNGSLIIFRS